MRVVLISTLAIIAAAGIAPAAFSPASPLTPSDPPPPGPRITAGKPFVDTMTKLDPGLWSISDGWANGSYMVNDWRASQARFDRGLTLTLAPGVVKESPYSSGEVQSRGRYGHGYYETTMRAAPGSGIITGFFTYTGPHFGQIWNEIDVEVLGAKPREVLLTYFFDGKKVSTAVPLEFDATAEAHTYGFDWQPGSIEWYVDGRPVHKVRGERLPLPNVAQKLMVSLWGSETLTDWAGVFSRNAAPTSASFTCIAHSRSAAEDMPCTARQSAQNYVKKQ